MNTQQIQFNRQWVAALLFAGLIVALAVGLVWAGADASGSTVQPAPMAQDCAYSLQPGQTGPSAADVDCPGADFSGGDSGLLPSSQLRSVKGGVSGGVLGD
jgi:hypothetical protein